MIHSLFNKLFLSSIFLTVLPALAMDFTHREKQQMVWDASHGHLDNVRLMIDKGMSINAQGDKGMTALHWAAQKGDARLVKELMQMDADPAIKNDEGKTSLHFAAGFGKKAVVGVILQNYKNSKELVDTADRRGQRALHWASWENHAGVVALLLEYGADSNAQDKNGATPLSWVRSETVMKILLKAGASLLPIDGHGSRPLHRISKNNINFASLLSGAPYIKDVVNARDNNGDSPLHKAAGAGRFKAIQSLLALGADPNARNSHGRTPVEVVFYNYRGAPFANEMGTPEYDRERAYRLSYDQLFESINAFKEARDLTGARHNRDNIPLIEIAKKLTFYANGQKSQLLALLSMVLSEKR